jgi:hypothetical protein
VSRRRRLERLEDERDKAAIASLADEEILDAVALLRRAESEGILALDADEVERLIRVMTLFDREAPVWVAEELAVAREAAEEEAAGEGGVRA